MDIKEFINKTCHSRREVCGLEKCLFYKDCIKDKCGDDCEPFVIRTLKAMIEEAEGNK